jgi:hypothetical protein
MCNSCLSPGQATLSPIITIGELAMTVCRQSQYFCNLSDKIFIKFRIKFSIFFQLNQFVSLFTPNGWVVKIYMFWKKIDQCILIFFFKFSIEQPNFLVFTRCGQFNFSFTTPVSTFQNKLPASALSSFFSKPQWVSYWGGGGKIRKIVATDVHCNLHLLSIYDNLCGWNSVVSWKLRLGGTVDFKPWPVLLSAQYLLIPTSDKTSWMLKEENTCTPTKIADRQSLITSFGPQPRESGVYRAKSWQDRLSGNRFIVYTWRLRHRHEQYVTARSPVTSICTWFSAVYTTDQLTRNKQLCRSAAQIRPRIHALTSLPVMFMGINMLPNKKFG